MHDRTIHFVIDSSTQFFVESLTFEGDEACVGGWCNKATHYSSHFIITSSYIVLLWVGDDCDITGWPGYSCEEYWQSNGDGPNTNDCSCVHNSCNQ